MRKKWLVLGVVVLSLLSLFGCEKKNIEINDIVSFDFGYSTGTHMDASVQYELKFEDGVYTAYIKPDGVAYEERSEYAVDESFVRELEDFLKENKVNRWNGFRKSNRHVLDGNSFNLSIVNGEYDMISASGYMKWPRNYREVKAGIIELFDGLQQKRVE